MSRLTRTERIRIRRLAEQGLSASELAWTYDVSTSTIHRVLRDAESSISQDVIIDWESYEYALTLCRDDDERTYVFFLAEHGLEEKFEVSNPAIAKDRAWIPDVSAVFSPDADLIEVTEAYVARNPAADRKQVGKILQKLGKIINNHIGIIELAEDLDIETVTEIFIRVNFAGAELSQVDFAMSKIAVNESYGGNLLRKAIDYFCHLAVAPEFLPRIEKGDRAFAASEFLPQMRWLADTTDDIYDPTYTDMLRVAFTSEFGRGKLQDLVPPRRPCSSRERAAPAKSSSPGPFTT